jgi:hypothetical protein
MKTILLLALIACPMSYLTYDYVQVELTDAVARDQAKQQGEFYQALDQMVINLNQNLIAAHQNPVKVIFQPVNANLIGGCVQQDPNAVWMNLNMALLPVDPASQQAVKRQFIESLAKFVKQCRPVIAKTPMEAAPKSFI